MEIIDFEYINKDNEIITVDKIEVDYMYNQNKFQQALLMYQENKDTYAFADKIIFKSSCSFFGSPSLKNVTLSTNRTNSFERY